MTQEFEAPYIELESGQPAEARQQPAADNSTEEKLAACAFGAISAMYGLVPGWMIPASVWDGYSCQAYQQCIASNSSSHSTNPYQPPSHGFTTDEVRYLSIFGSAIQQSMGIGFLGYGAFKMGAAESIFSKNFAKGFIYASIGAFAIGSDLALDYIATSLPLGNANLKSIAQYDGHNICENNPEHKDMHYLTQDCDSSDIESAEPYAMNIAKTCLVGCIAISSSMFGFWQGRKLSRSAAEQDSNVRANNPLRH